MYSTVSWLERHATGCTIVLFLLGVLGLSLAPLPEWLTPLDVLKNEDPVSSLISSVFRRPNSVPRKGDAAGHDWAIQDPKHEETEEEDQPRPEVEVVPPKQRTAWERPDRPKLEQARAKLHFTSAAIDNPCLEPGKAPSNACERRALDRFFDQLTNASDKKEDAIVRVVHYGDSIIASDHITDIVRARLQERFGSAGKGFLLVTRYNPRQRRLRTGDGTGWFAEHIAQGKLADAYFGYAGASFTAESAGAETHFDDVGQSRFVDIYYLAQPNGGAIEVYADRTLVRAIDTKVEGSTPASSFASVTLPEGTKQLRVRAKDKGARIFGVSLEANVPGVIYESIGIPGSTSEVWLYPDPVGFKKQLEHRDPALLVTQLGGNDARALHQKRRKLDAIEQSTRDFIDRLQASAPDADCLVLSPLDAVEAKTSGEMKSRPEVPQVIEIQRKIAAEKGCAFWNIYQSMGGPGSLERWYNAGLINPDLIHPRAAGGDLLGELMAEALMDAYDAHIADKSDVARAVP